MSDSKKRKSSTRREFMATTSKLAAAGGVVLAAGTPAFGVHSRHTDTLKVGVVGCGGRGTDAAKNAMTADDNCKITAMAEIFPDRLEESLRSLNTQIPDRLEIPEENKFTGWDCCEQLINSNVDVVILTTPPHFRPAQLRMAVEAGKHVFCEKPVAVDAPGVRSILETCELAKEKGLSVVSGLCWRYDHNVNEVMKRIKDGAIGDITAIQEDYLTGTLWHRGKNPEWSQMEYQVRNWLYFTWLSGDHIAEQHIHSIDKALWLMDDEPPVSCYGTGGRLVRTEEKYGNVYDHFATVFEWKNGVKCFAHCRQIDSDFNQTDDFVFGTKGQAQVLKGIVGGEKVRFEGENPGMYVVEHEHLFRSIRNGEPINNGEYMSYATLMAIMGREAAYTGRLIKWDEFIEDETRLGPDTYDWGDYEPNPVALPEPS